MLFDGEQGGPYHGNHAVDVVTAPPAGSDFSGFKPDAADNAFPKWRAYNLMIGERTSEEIKIKIGSVLEYTFLHSVLMRCCSPMYHTA